ncbi:MAG: BrnT family toxin [Syntrophobacteraceae bacterium]
MYIYLMRFEWDERKRLSNLEKHGLDFLDVTLIFEAPHIEAPSAYRGEEQRFLAIGTFDGRCVTIVYTIRSEAIRIISFRGARYAERQKYQELYGGGT